ncbi:hypothetical protein KDA_10470 [Dictyobacter alpinus]|uniref:Lipocalin-like domain-containing protein n=1 Tax=Dictyobacter alpinus TaxID=2014873 RepID=A0A402B2K6_9CHLR|nr:lipocalin-like domain-containing protein [Dictyobacter alpinus]GCE25563.1 hypothetical protein KDA_10470 [Dictyobacter alpinus]
MKQVVDPTMLFGTWILVAVEIRYSNGDVSYPWGIEPDGHLVYAADGYMSAVISAHNREHFTTNDILTGSMEEQARAARSYISYGGPYELQGNEVTHHVAVSLFPNWIGQAQKRFIELVDSERLILRSAPLLASGREGIGYLIWQRRDQDLDSSTQL